MFFVDNLGKRSQRADDLLAADPAFNQRVKILIVGFVSITLFLFQVTDNRTQHFAFVLFVPVATRLACRVWIKGKIHVPG